MQLALLAHERVCPIRSASQSSWWRVYSCRCAGSAPPGFEPLGGGSRSGGGRRRMLADSPGWAERPGQGASSNCLACSSWRWSCASLRRTSSRCVFTAAAAPPHRLRRAGGARQNQRDLARPSPSALPVPPGATTRPLPPPFAAPLPGPRPAGWPRSWDARRPARQRRCSGGGRSGAPGGSR